MHIKRHGFCKLNGSLGSDINSANATILIGNNSQLGDSNSLSDGDGQGTLSGVSLYFSSTDFSLFRFSPPPLWHTQPRAPTSAARVSTRLFGGGGEGMASCGGDTMTAGTFQGEMPALCGGGYLHNACMHLMTLTPQHTTSAVSRRGG